MLTAPQQSSQLEQELVEVKGLLRSAEEQNGEQAEQLKNANASVEQYRAVVLTLEDSLKKEKEVHLFVVGCSWLVACRKSQWEKYSGHINISNIFSQLLFSIGENY